MPIEVILARSLRNPTHPGRKYLRVIRYGDLVREWKVGQVVEVPEGFVEETETEV